jgi:Tubulin like
VSNNNDWRNTEPLRRYGQRKPAAERTSGSEMPLVETIFYITLGTFAYWYAAILSWIHRRAGRRVVVLAIDGDNARPPIATPDGETATVADEDFFLLNVEETLTRLLGTITAREKAHLRGWNFADLHVGNHGVGGARGLTTLVLQDHAKELYAAILRKVRELGRDAAAPRAQSDIERLALKANRATSAKRIRVVVIASGAGGVGSALCLFVPYLVRRAFKSVPTVELDALWLLLCGPNAFAGLHEYTEANWVHCIKDLNQLAQTGFNYNFGGDFSVRDARLPYDVILPFNNTAIPANGSDTTEAERAIHAVEGSYLAHAITLPGLADSISSRLVDPGPGRRWFAVPGLALAAWNRDAALAYARKLGYSDLLKLLCAHAVGSDEAEGANLTANLGAGNSPVVDLNPFIAAYRQTLQVHQLTADQAKSRLAEDESGKPFEPVQLPTMPSFYHPESFDEYYEMMMRPQAVGGGEEHLKRNALRFNAELTAQMLSSAVLNFPARQRRSIAEALREQERIARRELAQHTARYTEANEHLQEFQLKSQHQLSGVWHWALDAWESLAGKEKISPWAAADYFNQREWAAWQTQVAEALILIFASAAEQAEAEAQQWEALGQVLPQEIERVQRELSPLKQRMDARRPGATQTVRGSFVVESRLAHVSSALDPALLVVGPERIFERLQARAEEIVHAQIEPITVVDALEAEGQSVGLADPLIASGNELRALAAPLGAVLDDAHPRRMDFALFPTATPPVDAENLSVICGGPSDSIVYLTLLHVESDKLTAYHDALPRAIACAQKANLSALPETETPEPEPDIANNHKRRNGYEPAPAQSIEKEEK